MASTLILALGFILAILLMLYSAVALVQDKRLFSSAPKDIVDAIQPREERFFWRCLVILYIYKAFDLVFLDWVLLQKTRFFQHYYPETEGCAGYHSILFPFISALIAWLCTLI